MLNTICILDACILPLPSILFNLQFTDSWFNLVNVRKMNFSTVNKSSIDIMHESASKQSKGWQNNEKTRQRFVACTIKQEIFGPI